MPGYYKRAVSLSEVTRGLPEDMTVGRRAPRLYITAAFHLETEEIHLSPFWGEPCSSVGSKIHPAEQRMLSGRTVAIENSEWDAMWERK